MSLTQIINLREPKLTERIAEFISLDDELSAEFRGVYSKTNDIWSMIMGVIRLNDYLSASDFKACHYKYPDYQFICQPITGLSLAKLIHNVSENANTVIPGFPEFGERESNPNWSESLIPSHAHRDKFPVRRFSTRVCLEANCHDTKLVAYGMPFYSSAFQLTKNFLGLEAFHGSSDARKGELCIYIPDRRGHLVFSEHDIRFQSEAIDNLSVVGAIDGEQVKLGTPKDKFDFDPKAAQDVELWLVTKNNEIIDYCSSSEWEYKYGTQSNSSDLDNLISIILAGESERCEFKTYIDLVKTDAKAVELEKSVCAISNHQGGKLFIGVDDDTNIIGINEQCQKSYRCHPNEAIELYLRDVQKRLRELLVKNQCFSCRTIDHGKRTVLVVDIQKAAGLNYLLSTNDAYIRRGASSPRMTPTEVQAFPVERDVLGREILADDFGSERDTY